MEILKFYNRSDTAGHYGIQRTTQKITSRYYWPRIRRDVAKYVKECVECQIYKVTNVKPDFFRRFLVTSDLR